ncbi:PIG-L family deacetylase [Frigoribacterium sp. 2-23]|uniref:PIG-L family deacetylase n=1 Tax=Frigoribacterium sp. 2-23 TaxID=3415006 RepID=UPI003C6F791A
MSYFGTSSVGSRTSRVLFVHAHPDDETITTGGTIASLVSDGADVTVVTCTRGELGEVIADDLARLRDDPAALAVHRELEIAAAMRDLGVRDHRFLGDPEARTAGLPSRAYRDSGMQWRREGVAGPTDDLHASAFCAAEFGEIVSDLSAVVESVHPSAIVSYDDDGGYGHPDHVRANRAALKVARLAGIPFFAIVSGAEQATGSEAEALAADPTVTTFDVRRVAPQKLAALREYRTQLDVVDLADNRPGLRYPHGAVEPMALSESFRLVPEPESERVALADEMSTMTTGSRAIVYGIALAAGLVAGAVGTVSHQGTVTVGGVPVWSGLALSLLMTLALLLGLRLVLGSRLVCITAAVGLLAAVGVLALPGAGGSALVPANVLGYAWTFGPVAIALLVIGWPRAQQHGDKMRSLPDVKGTPQT